MELSLNLQVCGLMGEGHVGESDNVMIVKTHFPLRNEFELKFNANKQFVLMRNPIDVIPSHTTLINTTSHSLTPTEDYHIDFPEYWKWIVDVEVNAIKAFFERNKHLVSQQIPTYFIRFEDLMTEPQRVLTELFCFIFEVPSIEGTVLE
jgi:hypothetical protein